ncbi:MAG: hypothetical protein WBW25_06110 [Halobacteriota archaeon]
MNLELAEEGFFAPQGATMLSQNSKFHQRQKTDQFSLATLNFGFTRRQFIDRSGLAQRNLGQRGAGRGQAGTGLVSLLAFGVI